MFCPRETATEITSTTNHDDDDDVDIDYVVADKRIHINSLQQCCWHPLLYSKVEILSGHRSHIFVGGGYRILKC